MAVATILPSPVRSTGRRAGRWRFSVDEYIRLHERGIIPEDVRTELIEGEIRVMSPLSPPHNSSTMRLMQLLIPRAHDRAEVSINNCLQIGEASMFRPDVAVLLPDPSSYFDRYPSAADTMFVVEVAHASVRYDRRRKLPIYARFGVPEVWIAALGEQVLDVYRRPEGGQYTDTTVLKPSDTVAPLALPDVIIDVGDVLRSEFWAQRRR